MENLIGPLSRTDDHALPWSRAWAPHSLRARATRFSGIILDAVGGSINKGEAISLGWEGQKMVVLVRDRPAGTVVDAALPEAVFALYLGDSPVSPEAKAAFAEGLPAFLAS